MSKTKPAKKTPQEVLVSLVCTALLIALQVVLSRWLSIQTTNIKIGFSFIPVVVAARLFGPLSSMAVYGIGDVIGSILFPKGAYFPGFTVTSVLMGLVYGLFLYKKSNPTRVVLSVAINQSLFSFLLNSFWIAYIAATDKSQLLSVYKAQLSVRWIQSLGMGIVMIIMLSVLLERVCVPIEKNVLKKRAAAKTSETAPQANI